MTYHSDDDDDDDDKPFWPTVGSLFRSARRIRINDIFFRIVGGVWAIHLTPLTYHGGCLNNRHTLVSMGRVSMGLLM
jgi:hypothetical protein